MLHALQPPSHYVSCAIQIHSPGKWSIAFNPAEKPMTRKSFRTRSHTGRKNLVKVRLNTKPEMQKGFFRMQPSLQTYLRWCLRKDNSCPVVTFFVSDIAFLTAIINSELYNYDQEKQWKQSSRKKEIGVSIFHVFALTQRYKPALCPRSSPDF